MENKIIEIVEISQPQSTIIREGGFRDTIFTYELVKELNRQLKEIK